MHIFLDRISTIILIALSVMLQIVANVFSPICSKSQRSVQGEGEEIHGFTFQKIRFTVSARLIHEINVKI